MSLSVPPNILARMQRGESISETEFLNIISDSLPHAWRILHWLKDETASAHARSTPVRDEERGQILRALSGTAMRTTLEQHLNRSFSTTEIHGVCMIYAGKHLSEDDLPELSLNTLMEKYPRAMDMMQVMADEVRGGNEFIERKSRGDMPDETRLQLLHVASNLKARAIISNEMGMEIGFKNCEDVSGTKKDKPRGTKFREFVSIPAQLQNQSPERRHC